MLQWISPGWSRRRSSAPSPSRSAAPGAKFWTNTAAPATSSRTRSNLSGSLRSGVTDSFERLSIFEARRLRPLGAVHPDEVPGDPVHDGAAVAREAAAPRALHLDDAGA